MSSTMSDHDTLRALYFQQNPGHTMYPPNVAARALAKTLRQYASAQASAAQADEETARRKRATDFLVSEVIAKMPAASRTRADLLWAVNKLREMYPSTR
jgi:hypothetical protein